MDTVSDVEYLDSDMDRSEPLQMDSVSNTVRNYLYHFHPYLKDKLTSFKMKEDENIPKIFHRLQVIVNDLKALGEKINDDDVSHLLLMCLPPILRLRLIIIRE